MHHSVIHIGANKTASTTLQRALFKSNKQLQYLGEDCDDYADYAFLLNALVNDDDLFYSDEACAQLFSSKAEQAGFKTFLYSNEDVMTSRIPLICAKRLKSLMPDAEIVLVIRNQQTAIPSFYASHGAFLKPAPPSYFRRHVAFDDWIDFQTMFGKYGPLASFNYAQFESIYSSLFGGRVHILLFEEFLNDQLAFVEKLSILLRIDPKVAMQALKSSHERRRITGRTLVYNQFRTYFFWGAKLSKFMPFGDKLANIFNNFLAEGSPAKIGIKTSTHQKISDMYSEGNTVLSKKYNLPLEKYGYPMITSDT